MQSTLNYSENFLPTISADPPRATMFRRIVCVIFRIIIVQLFLLQLFYSLATDHFLFRPTHTVSAIATVSSRAVEKGNYTVSGVTAGIQTNRHLTIVENSISLQTKQTSKTDQIWLEQRIHELDEKDRRLTYEQRAARAFAHGVQIQAEASCGLPRPRLIYVGARQKRRTVFLPRATFLHRCEDSVGCCATDRERCVAVDWRPVSLYFFTISPEAGVDQPPLFPPNRAAGLDFDDSDLLQHQLLEDRALLDRLRAKRKRQTGVRTILMTNDRRKRKLQALTLPVDADEPLLAGRWVAARLAKKGQFRQAVERLVFANHTRCVCVDKNLL